MDWKTLLAYITGTVDQELLVRNEYLVTENRILRNQIKGRLRLSDGERKALAEIGQKLSREGVADLLIWYPLLEDECYPLCGGGVS
jgi:putative transposase